METFASASCTLPWMIPSQESCLANAGTLPRTCAPSYSPLFLSWTSPTPSVPRTWTPLSCTAAGGTLRVGIRSTRISLGGYFDIGLEYFCEYDYPWMIIRIFSYYYCYLKTLVSLYDTILKGSSHLIAESTLSSSFSTFCNVVNEYTAI